MGATRLASGKMQRSYTKQRLTDSTNYTPICESFALITERGTRLLKRPTRDASLISACVFYQIDRLKSGFEAMGRTVMPGICALMGATRLASGKMQCSYPKRRLTDSTNYTPICESFALITERGTRLLKRPTRDASPPLVLAFSIRLTD